MLYSFLLTEFERKLNLKALPVFLFMYTTPLTPLDNISRLGVLLVYSLRSCFCELIIYYLPTKDSRNKSVDSIVDIKYSSKHENFTFSSSSVTLPVFRFMYDESPI